MDVAVYERPAVRITIPHPECYVDGCSGPLQADMVWHDVAHGALHFEQICGRCLFIFREVVREGRGGALFFPLNSAPPLEFIGAKVQEYLRARQPRPVYQPMWGNINYSFNTGTGAGGTWTHTSYG